MSAPEQVIRETLQEHPYPTAKAAALAALDVLVAERDEIKEKFDHLHSEWGFGHHRGDHLVYESEWEAFDKWQRAGIERTTP